MSVSLANFLFEAANFLLLAAALGWLLFRPVRAALDAERDRHAALEAEIEKRRGEAEASAAQARSALAEVEHESESRRAEMLAAAQKEIGRLQEEARRKHSDQRRALEGELEAVRLAEVRALTDTVGRIATASVGRLLENLDGPSLDLALVRAACDELSALPPSARETAKVESARPLGEEAHRLLEEALGATFDERSVAELGAGVRVTTAAGQVDASALGIARQAAREVASVVTDVAQKARAPEETQSAEKPQTTEKAQTAETPENVEQVRKAEKADDTTQKAEMTEKADDTTQKAEKADG